MKPLYLTVLALLWVLAALLYRPVVGAPEAKIPLNVTRETPAATSSRPVSPAKPKAKPKPLTPAQLAIQQQVVEAFPDVPAMVAVVRCESRYRQFDAAGGPLISPTDDVGVMQINIPSWGPLAKKLGLDIYGSVTDNIVMGRIVYAYQGLGAWTCA